MMEMHLLDFWQNIVENEDLNDQRRVLEKRHVTLAEGDNKTVAPAEQYANHQPDHQPQYDLSEDLEPGCQSLLVLFEHFDIIIQESYESKPSCRYKDKDNVDVVKFCKEKCRYEDGSQDDQPAHSGGACLFQLPLKTQVPHRFSDLFALQPPDQGLADDHGDQQGGDHCHGCPERYILKHTGAGQVIGLIEESEQMVQHISQDWGFGLKISLP